MSGGPGGLGSPGTSGQTFNASGGSNQSSQTNPYGPTQGSLQNLISEINGAGTQPYQPLVAGGQLPSQDTNLYNQAISQVGALPNFGPATGTTALNMIASGGDPSGILKQEQSNLNPFANMGGADGSGLDPTKTPGMANVLKTIQNDVSNSVNGQFAGAGRSLSGLNEQTLSRGISQGESVPLLNQYNQNFANMLGANQALGGVQNSKMANIGAGINYAQLAPMLAAMNPLMQEQILQQKNNQPLNYLAQIENMLNPIAGLGGTSQGQQQTQQQGSGTATSSLLSQLGQAAGLISPVGGLLGTLFG